MTDEALPHFRYHPDPIRTGVVEASSGVCACCGQARGFVYTGPVYGEEELDDRLCPWCIADGSAAANLGASFADDWALVRAGVAREIVEEVNERIDTVIAVGISTRCEDGEDNMLAPLLDKLGYYYARAKTNMGLGRVTNKIELKQNQAVVS